MWVVSWLAFPSDKREVRARRREAGGWRGMAESTGL
jgi:hypothetical protein